MCLSPGVLLWLQKGSPLTWSVSPSSRLCPPSCLIFQAVFWCLKRRLRSVCDSDFTPTHPHCPCLLLCCPLTIHLTHLECERWQHPGVKMNASHKKMWFEMCYGKERKKKKKKLSMMGKNYFLFCIVLFFNFSKDSSSSDSNFTTKKFWQSWQRLWKDDSTSNLRVIREFPMEFRECCKCVLPLHQNIKKGLWHG